MTIKDLKIGDEVDVVGIRFLRVDLPTLSVPAGELPFIYSDTDCTEYGTLRLLKEKTLVVRLETTNEIFHRNLYKLVV